MKSMKSLAMIACLSLLTLGASPALPPPPSPLKVTLTLLNPCPISLDQSLDLRAQITGGYQHAGLPGLLPVMTRYSFYAQLGSNNIVIKQDTADARVGWVPKLPGFYHINVVVKQTLQGTVVAQAAAEFSGASLCEVKKVMYQVTLNVSPPSGQAEAPPQTAATQLTLSASVSPAFGNGTNEFRFSVAKMGGSGVVAMNTVRTGAFAATCPPLNPPQPAEPGLYRLFVQVVNLQSSPQGDVVAAEGEKEIVYYEAKPARPHGNVLLGTLGDPTMVKPAPPSQVTLTVTPQSPSPSAGTIALTAAVAVPGNPSGVTNKFTFSYAPSAGGQPVSQILQTSAASQNWTLSPQPAPGTYNLVASVETRRTTDNTLLAQGSGQIANYVVAGATYPFGWLFPVTTQNTTLAVGTTYGSATNTMAGNSINDIVNTSGVRVRADNTACAQCHGGSFSKDGFCSSASLYLSKGPHATSGQPADQTLGSLFTNWKGRNCPN